MIFSLIGFLMVLALYSEKSEMVIANYLKDDPIPTDSLFADCIPNEETAKKIAEAIWLPIYGEEVLKQKPYEAELVNDIWIVKGSLYIPPYENPKYFRGGTAYIEIQKRDCKVLKITHGR